jgi:hypothetical protein
MGKLKIKKPRVAAKLKIKIRAPEQGNLRWTNILRRIKSGK